MKRLLFLIATAALSTACATHKLEPPQGFAQVSHDEYSTVMMAPDHVGMNVRVWDNVKGGSLSFWGEDLVNKLGTRGYTLKAQKAVKSKNGVAGTRFDFDYTAPDGVDKFYSAVLFTSDEYRVVLQIAGNAELGPRHLAELDGIAAQTKVHGCKPMKSLCKSAQPRPLSSPQSEETPAPKAEDTAPKADEAQLAEPAPESTETDG